MTARPVHDDSRPEVGSAELVSWRKSRRSAAGPGAACVEATLALARPDGSVSVPLPDGSEFEIEPPLSGSSVPQFAKPPTESVEPWTRGSLEEDPDLADLLTRPQGPNGTDLAAQLENAHGLPGLDSQTHEPSQEHAPSQEHEQIQEHEQSEEEAPDEGALLGGLGDGHGPLRFGHGYGGGPVFTPARNDDLVRIRYQEAAEQFERNFARTVVYLPEVQRTVSGIVRALWQRTPQQWRNRLLTSNRSVPGSVGNDLRQLRNAVYHGNTREHMAILFQASASYLTQDLLGLPRGYPPTIEQQRAWRYNAAANETFAYTRPAGFHPPLSDAERAFTRNGDTWVSAASWTAIRMAPPPGNAALAGRTYEDSPHAAAQRTGGSVLTGTSGSMWYLLLDADALNRSWGLGLDLRNLVLAGAGVYGGLGHHVMSEVIAAADLWANDPAHPDRQEYGFNFVDTWAGRYRSLGTLDEGWLRNYVAEGGRFPDEIANDVATYGTANNPVVGFGSDGSHETAVPVSPDSLGAEIGGALRGGDDDFLGRAFVPTEKQQEVLSSHFATHGANLRTQEILHVVPSGDDGLRVVGSSKSPWADEGSVYVAQVHQSGGVFTVPVDRVSESRGTTGQLDPSGFGRGLTRRPSLANLGEKAPVVLVSCATATVVEGREAPAQVVANETGRVVYAPTTDIFVSDDGFALAADEFGRPGQWMKFYPGGERAPEIVTADMVPVRGGAHDPSLESSAPSTQTSHPEVEVDQPVLETGDGAQVEIPEEFNQLKEFYSPEGFQRAYPDDTQDALIELESGGSGHTLTMTRPGSDESLTVTLTHDPAANTVSVLVKPSDGEGVQHTYAPEEIDGIAASLTSGDRDPGDAFGALPLPEDWHDLPEGEHGPELAGIGDEHDPVRMTGSGNSSRHSSRQGRRGNQGGERRERNSSSRSSSNNSGLAYGSPARSSRSSSTVDSNLAYPEPPGARAEPFEGVYRSVRFSTTRDGGAMRLLSQRIASVASRSRRFSNALDAAGGIRVQFGRTFGGRPGEWNADTRTITLNPTHPEVREATSQGRSLLGTAVFEVFNASADDARARVEENARNGDIAQWAAENRMTRAAEEAGEYGRVSPERFFARELEYIEWQNAMNHRNAIAAADYGGTDADLFRNETTFAAFYQRQLAGHINSYEFRYSYLQEEARSRAAAAGYEQDPYDMGDMRGALPLDPRQFYPDTRGGQPVRTYSPDSIREEDEYDSDDGRAREQTYGSSLAGLGGRGAMRFGHDQGGPVFTPARNADLVAIRYQEAAEQFERNFAAQVVYLPEVRRTVEDLAVSVWNATPDELKPGLIANNRTLPGSTGHQIEDLFAVLQNGNIREHMAVLFQASANRVTEGIYGLPRRYPQEIQEQRAWRYNAADDETFLYQRPEQIHPPLSDAERAFTRNGDTWVSAASWTAIRMAPPPGNAALAGRTYEDSPHADAQRTGGSVLTGISGSTYFLLMDAEATNHHFGLGLDLRNLVLAAAAVYGGLGHHVMSEVLAAAHVWANEPGHEHRQGLGFGFSDTWAGRYRSLGPLDEDWLRQNVAENGRFPDEIANDVATYGTANNPVVGFGSDGSHETAVPVSPDSLGAEIGGALRGEDDSFLGRAFVPTELQQEVLSSHFATHGANLRTQEILHVVPSEDDGLRVVGSSKSPWADEGSVYVAQVHQSGGVFTVPVDRVSESRGTTGQLDPSGFGRGLTRRPSLANLGEKAPVVLVSCATATVVEGREAPAQVVANETGRVVYAPTTDIFVSDDGFALAADEFGRPGQWMKFYPGGERAPEIVTGDMVPARDDAQVGNLDAIRLGSDDEGLVRDPDDVRTVAPQLESTEGRQSPESVGEQSPAQTPRHLETEGSVSPRGLTHESFADSSSEDGSVQGDRPDAMRGYADSGLGMVQAMAELREARAQVEETAEQVHGPGPSQSEANHIAAQERFAQAQRDLTAAEARFDAASDKLERLGLARPAEEADLESAQQAHAFEEADRLLGMPRTVIGTDDESVATRAAQDLIREHVAELILHGAPDDAGEMAEEFGSDLFSKQGLAGGALEVARVNQTEYFRTRSDQIEQEVHEEILDREQQLRAGIDRDQRRLDGDIADANRGYADEVRSINAREADDQRDYQNRRAPVDRELAQLERTDPRSLNSQQVVWARQRHAQLVQARRELDAQGSAAVGHYAQLRGGLEQRRLNAGNDFTRHQDDIDARRTSARQEIARMRRDEGQEVLRRQRNFLNALVEDFKTRLAAEQRAATPFTAVRPFTRSDNDAYFDNLSRIEYKLKKLIVEPTGHVGYHDLLQGNIGRHPIFGAKMHNVKVNNVTELARALTGWVEAKPQRHQEKVLAEQIVADRDVSKLLDVVLWRINNKIAGLPNAAYIRRELASGRSEFDPDKTMLTYITHSARSGRPETMTRLSQEPDKILAVLREPGRFDLREKIMVIHDLFEYFGPNPRHTARTHGTGLMPAETHDQAMSTTSVDNRGYRVSSSLNRGQNPVVQADGTTKEHPSTRNEYTESTMLARERRIPVWAGQSFTSMRMFLLADWAGASKREIGAVGYGVFTMWRLNYDHTTPFAYHTLHEVLDIAQNFGVPYSMDHQTATLDHTSLSSELSTANRFAAQLGRGRAPRAEGGMQIDHDPRVLQQMGQRLAQAAQDYQAPHSTNGTLRAAARLLDTVDRVKDQLGLPLDPLVSRSPFPRSPYSLRDGFTEDPSLRLESDGPGSARPTRVSDDPVFTAAREAVEPVRRTHTWIDPVSRVVDADGNVQYVHDDDGNVVDDRSGNPVPQRFEVHADFDVRRFEVGGQKYTDLTVKVRADGTSLSDDDLAAMWDRAQEGVQRFYNDAGMPLGDSDTQLHLTIEQVAQGQRVDPNLAQPMTISRADSIEDMNQNTWFPGASPVDFAGEIGHQLGIRDEYRGGQGSGIDHRPNIRGSLFGDYRKPIDTDLPRLESDPELQVQGLRDRYLQLVDRIVGDDVRLWTEPELNLPHPVAESFAPGDATRTDLAPQPPRFGSAPVGTGWAHARWAQSWGLDFDPRAGTAHDALLTAGGGSLTVDGRVVPDEDALRQELGMRIAAAEPSEQDWAEAAEHLGASVLLLHGDGTMSAHGEGPVLVLAEAEPEADGAPRWVGVPTSSEGPALSGLSAAQVEWAASEGKRFAGPGGGFYDVLSAAARDDGIAEFDFAPQVLRDRLVDWMRTGLSDEGWARMLDTVGIQGSHDPAVREQVIENVRQGVGESMDELLPLLADVHFKGGLEVVRADGEAYSRLPEEQDASITLVPAGRQGDTWFRLAQVRQPRTAGAGTRPADVAGGLGRAEPPVPVTGAERHIGAEPSEAQQEWAFDHGRRLVEVPDGPHAVFDAILTASGGGITMRGEYVGDPARLRQLMGDEVRPALAQDLGLALVVHTIYAAHTPGGEGSVDSGRAQAEIIRALREPGFRPDLADELAPYFANRLGLGVRTVDPTGVVGRYGSGRPVYLGWTRDGDGNRHWAAAPSDESRYVLDSPLRAPNRSDPALYLLTHAIEARKDALRGGGTGEIGDDRLLNILDDAQSRWIVHGQTPKSAPDTPTVDLRQPQNLRDAVGGLVRAVHDAIGGDGAVSHVGLGSGLHTGMAVRLFDGLFPRGIGHEPGTDGAARADLAGLPADHWVTAPLSELVDGLPRGGAALYLGGDRTVVVFDTGEGRTLVEFGTDGVGGPITGRVDLHTPGSAHSGGGLALVVDEGGHPLTADELYEQHGQDFGSATGWSFGAGVKQADPETGAPVGVSAPQADLAERHGVGFVPAESGLNAKFDAVLKAAGGSLTGHGVTVQNPTELRQALAEHVRRLTAAPNSLRDYPSIHAAFVAEGADRVIEEFFGQDPHGANATAVYRQLDEHIGSGQAAEYVARAVAEPNHWEQVAHSVALDLVADWSGRGVLEVDPRGQVRLHGDPTDDTIAVGRLGSGDTERPGWFAYRSEHEDAEPFGDLQPHSTTSLTARPPRTESGTEDFYHAVLDASGGAVQIDRDTLVDTPAELKQQLTTFLLERPDVLDPATRAAIEHETGIGAHAGVDELIDALNDPESHNGEVVARHLIGSYLNTHLRVVEPDGSEHTYGSGRPITVESVEDRDGEGRWAAPTLESRDLDLGHDLDLDHGQEARDGAATAVTADDERVAQAQWAPESFNLKAPDEVQAEDPWRSSKFCIEMEIDGEMQKACVSVAVLTLDAELAAELGVAMP